jgi:hypothetical protein
LYTNIWGELVLKVRGIKHILKPNPDKKVNKIDRGGHAIPGGFYNIDEEGNEIFGSENFDEYIRIEKTVKLLDKVNDAFKGNDIILYIGPNNSVLVDEHFIVPDCYWDIPENMKDLNTYAEMIVQKVKAYILPLNPITDAAIIKLEKIVIDTFCNLDVSYLSDLDESYMYSDCFKDEVIIHFAKQIKAMLLKGITTLNMKNSACLFCYPDCNAYSFHHPQTDELMVRYVVGKSKNQAKEFILQECLNKQIPDGKNGMPF